MDAFPPRPNLKFVTTPSGYTMPVRTREEHDSADFTARVSLHREDGDIVIPGAKTIQSKANPDVWTLKPPKNYRATMYFVEP